MGGVMRVCSTWFSMRDIFLLFLIRIFVQMMKVCLIVRKKWKRRRSLQFIHGRGSASVIIFGASQPEIRPRILRKLTTARLQIEQTAGECMSYVALIDLLNRCQSFHWLLVPTQCLDSPYPNPNPEIHMSKQDTSNRRTRCSSYHG